MNDFDNRIALAQDLRKRYSQQVAGAQAPQGRMVGNQFVAPNVLEYLAQGLRGIGGMQGEAQADKELGVLQTQRTEGNQKALADFLRQSQGQAAQPEMQGNNPSAYTPPQAAQAPNMQGAYASLMQAPDQSYRQMGMQGQVGLIESEAKRAQALAENQRVMGALKAAKSPQEALAAGVPSELVKNFYESGNWGKNKGVAINGQLVDPLTGQTIGAPIPKQADMSSDLLIPGPDGKLVPNTALIGVKEGLAQAGKSTTNVSVNTGQKGFDNTLKLRGDFRSEPNYKAHQEMQSAHAQIGAGLKQGTPVGDLASATKIMKLLDPGSVVRESELGMAMAASGLGDRLANYAQNVISGNKLTPTQRKDFQALADQLFAESVSQYNNKRAEYKQIAERNQLNIDDVVGPESKAPKIAPKAPPSGGFTDAEKERRYQEWKAKQK